jgi:hypothetical protein
MGLRSGFVDGSFGMCGWGSVLCFVGVDGFVSGLPLFPKFGGWWLAVGGGAVVGGAVGILEGII